MRQYLHTRKQAATRHPQDHHQDHRQDHRQSQHQLSQLDFKLLHLQLQTNFPVTTP